MFNPLEVQNGPASRDMRYKIQKWNVNSEKVHPILVANARVDWMSLDDSDITQQLGRGMGSPIPRLQEGAWTREGPKFVDGGL